MLISNNCFICLFVFWGISSHSKNFSLKWRRHHYGKFYFDLCSALMVIGLWRFFSVPHLLWHEISIYNGHLAPRTRDTHNFCRVLPVELSLPVFTTSICCAGIRTPNLPLAGPTLLPTAPPPWSIVLQYFMHQCNCN